MKILKIILGLSVWGCLFVFLQPGLAVDSADAVSDGIRKRIIKAAESQNIVCNAELLCGSSIISKFYPRRGFRPAWSTADGVAAQARLLVDAIARADANGLTPEDYHLETLKRLLAETEATFAASRPPDTEKLADLDLLLTDAFLLYGSHLSAGRVNPETIQTEWFIKTRKAKLEEILEKAVSNGRIDQTLESLAPPHGGYARLTNALSRYRIIEDSGGWPVIPSGPKMRRGANDPRVPVLRTRLSASGDLDQRAATLLNQRQPYRFDANLQTAVRRFQQRHGLFPDAVVGSRTLAALNVPLQSRIQQLKLNMERWRWLPNDFGRRYILVNIANFRLEVIEDGQTVESMRVVVGREYRSTPVFSDNMTYLEINPYWHIPSKIAREDILPKIQQDPAYLHDQRIRVFESWRTGAAEILPESIDWSRVTAGNFSFKLLQEPAVSNALGRVKFMFPNKFGVYLHDTPARYQFKKIKRSFSSGCIRLERPVDMANYLLKDAPGWNREKISETIRSGKTQVVVLPEAVPIHILYWTAWVDENGWIHFRDDIYGRDKLLAEAFDKRAPKPNNRMGG